MVVTGYLGVEGLTSRFDEWRVHEWRALTEGWCRWAVEPLCSGIRLSHDRILPSVVVPMSSSIIHHFQKAIMRETHKTFYQVWSVGPLRSSSYGTMEVLIDKNSHLG